MAKKKRPDEAHQMTDAELILLEQRIARLYKEAADELQQTIDEYFKKLAEREKHQQELLEAGKISQQQYTLWRMAQFARGSRFEALRDIIAYRYTHANEIAIAYANDLTPGIYSLNRNYIAYTIVRDVPGASFTMFDERTVRRLIKDDPDLMPYYPKKKAIERGIDLEYGRKRITQSVTSGILQGLDIYRIANKLQEDMYLGQRAGALRTARTAVTSAQNAGRMDALKEAENMGIKVKRLWIATLDNRTRHAHQKLDGQEVIGTDTPFKSKLGDIMFPGDPAAHPANIYNCRCTLGEMPVSFDKTKLKRRMIDPVTGKSVEIGYRTFTENEEYWKSADPAAWELYMRKGRNLSRDKKQHEEYRAILGELIPVRLDDFQEMKYTEPEHWRDLITQKVQTVAVNEAECVTTPKKFSGYFLRAGANHADDFFNVGYSADNPLQLRYDIARQFDRSRAVDVEVDDAGVETFNIYMPLGVTKERMFLTGWRIDRPGERPRIITGFRKDNPNDK